MGFLVLNLSIWSSHAAVTVKLRVRLREMGLSSAANSCKFFSVLVLAILNPTRVSYKAKYLGGRTCIVLVRSNRKGAAGISVDALVACTRQESWGFFLH